MQSREVLLHLSLIPQIGPATVEKLIQTLGAYANLPNLYHMQVQDLVHYGSLSYAIAQRIKEGLQDTGILERELALIERHHIQWISLYDGEYPPLLKAIYLPPLVLYVQGNAALLHSKSLACVGSRKADTYGFVVIKKLLPSCIEQGWTLVSGGALGIDTLVHKAAVEARGNTIAVLGSGLLRPYPSSNRELFKKIQETGAVVSAFPLSMEPLAGNFPARNRILAGLSKGCIVVQAALKSGALITARYALEQGREVGAVPGSVDNPLSAGCHQLIQEGAALIASAEDILTLLGETAVILKPKNDVIFLTPSSQLLSVLATPLSFDELLVKTGLQESILRDLLFELQLDGRITQNFMGLWHSS
jgi:DNA processing protein